MLNLSLFEQVLTCKLGADPQEIIPRIRDVLKNSQFTFYNPKKFIFF